MKVIFLLNFSLGSGRASRMGSYTGSAQNIREGEGLASPSLGMSKSLYFSLNLQERSDAFRAQETFLIYVDAVSYTHLTLPTKA